MCSKWMRLAYITPKDQPPCNSTKMDSSVSSLDEENTVTAASSQGSEE